MLHLTFLSIVSYMELVKIYHIYYINFVTIKQKEGYKIMNYAQRLIELRKEKELTQTDISIILDTSRVYYGEYERGNRPLPVEHLITLSKYYNVSTDYILCLTDTR